MIALPRFPVEGGCACHAVRYRLTRAPAFVYTCHCTDCQTLSQSAFSLNAPVRTETLEILQGVLMSWTRTAESGNKSEQYVCAACGVRIYTAPAARPDIYTLRCGTLDDTRWLEPAAAIWMKSAQPWVRMPEGCLRYEEGFGDPGPIIERFKALTGTP